MAVFDPVRAIDEISRSWGDALSRETQKVVTSLRRDVADALSIGMKKGMSQGRIGAALNDWVSSSIGNMGDEIEKVLSQSARVDAAAMKAQQHGHEAWSRSLFAQSEALNRQAQSMMDGMTQQTTLWHKEIALQEKAWKEINSERARTTEEEIKGWEEGATKAGSILSQAMSGDVFGMARSGAGGAGKGAQKLMRQSRFQEKEASRLGGESGRGEEAKAAAATGAKMAKAAKALGAFAAVAGVIVVLIKLFVDLQGKMIDMNKTMLESAGAADFGLGHMDIVAGGLNERLDEMRRATADLNDAFYKFGATAKEQQGILAALNQSGFTYAKMVEGATSSDQRMKALNKTLESVLVQARLVGVAGSEMAETMGKFTLETGLNLQEMAQQFSTITQEAMRAGFTTKRFYAAVVEATSGMAFYGLRIEQASQLLSGFDALLGETVGTDAFKRLAGSFKDTSEADKIRQAILTGQDEMRTIIGTAFRGEVKALERDFGQMLGGRDIASMLTNMTEAQLRDQLGEAGIFAPEDIRRFTRARGVGLGEEGELGDITRAMSLNPEIGIRRMFAGNKVFGGQSLGDVLQRGPRAEERVAVQQQMSSMGFGGMDMETLQETLGGMEHNWNQLVKIRDILQVSEGDLDALPDHLKKEFEHMKKAFGVDIDGQTGEIKKGDTVLRDKVDLLVKTDVLSTDKLKAQLTKDQELAAGISDNLIGLGDILEQTVAKILTDIYGVLFQIGKKFLGDDPKKLAKIGAIEAAKVERLQQIDIARKQSKALQETDRKIRFATDEKEKDKLRKQKDQQTKALEATRRQITLQSRMASAQQAAPLGEDTYDIGLRAASQAGLLGGEAPLMSRHHRSKTKGAVSQAFSGPVGQMSSFARSAANLSESGAMGDVTAEKMAAQFRAGLENMSDEDRKLLLDLAGTDENIAEAMTTAAEAMTKVGEKIEKDTWTQESEYKQLMAIGQTAFMNQLIAGNVEGAEDLIIPGGGHPAIITDPADTIVASKPGGPISRAGGGGGGRMTVNVYGGNQREVYNTVVKAAKAMGIA